MDGDVFALSNPVDAVAGLVLQRRVPECDPSGQTFPHGIKTNVVFVCCGCDSPVHVNEEEMVSSNQIETDAPST